MPVKKSTPNRTIYLNEVTIQSTNEVIKFIYEVNIEDKNSKHLFEGVDEIKEVLRKLIK